MFTTQDHFETKGNSHRFFHGEVWAFKCALSRDLALVGHGF